MPSLYAATIPGLLRGIQNLSGIIDYSAEFARQNLTPESDYTTAKLAPDMWDLAAQIYLVTGLSQRAVWQITDLNPLDEPYLPDGIKTFEELKGRLSRTIRFLEGVDPKKVDELEENGAEVEVKTPVVIYKYDNRAYCRDLFLTIMSLTTLPIAAVDFEIYHSLPQVWFHISIAYAILRMKGVDIGKLDFMNGAKKLNVRRA